MWIIIFTNCLARFIYNKDTLLTIDYRDDTTTKNRTTATWYQRISRKCLHSTILTIFDHFDHSPLFSFYSSRSLLHYVLHLKLCGSLKTLLWRENRFFNIQSLRLKTPTLSLRNKTARPALHSHNSFSSVWRFAFQFFFLNRGLCLFFLSPPFFLIQFFWHHKLVVVDLYEIFTQVVIISKSSPPPPVICAWQLNPQRFFTWRHEICQGRRI